MNPTTATASTTTPPPPPNRRLSTHLATPIHFIKTTIGSTCRHHLATPIQYCANCTAQL